MAPLLWIFMAALSLIVEVVSKCRLIGIWITFGCLIGAALSLLGIPSIVQYAIAALASLGGLYFLRDRALGKVEEFFDAHSDGRLGAYADSRIVGSRVKVVKTMSAKNPEGTVETRAGRRYGAVYDGARKLKSQEWAAVVDRMGSRLVVTDIKQDEKTRKK